VDAARRIAELRRAIDRADHLYYNLAAPELSDAEYDALFAELKALEAAHPELVAPDSPTQRVGAPLPAGSAVATADHLEPMLSIDSLTTEDDVREFDARARRVLGLGPDSELRWAVEPKLDGVSANLLYEHGVLVTALSRGDGRRGEDITRNVKTVRSVPLRLRGGPFPARMEVRGEVIMSRAAFAQLQESAETTTDTQFRNPRNTVAGTLKQLDPRVVRRRPLEFFCWGIGATSGELAARSHAELRETLAGFGIPVPADFRVVRDVAGIVGFHREMEARRDAFPFEMDGVVAKVDDLELQRRLGRTARAPRWCLAYKFAPRQAVTQVIGVHAQVGRTGAVTPVAELAPIELGGVTVKRATLHNWGLLQERDVRVGDTVAIERAGDVIPEVLHPLLDRRPAAAPRIEPPTRCPVCGSALEAEGAFLYCVNFECKAQVRGRIVHMAGRRALDIDRLGPKYVDQLVAAGLVERPEDVFLLQQRRAEILALDRWGEKSFDKLAQELERAKQPTLARFVYALGIRHVGEQTAEDLAAHFGSIERLESASEEELCEVDGVGPQVAASIRRFFSTPGNRRFLDTARAAGVAVAASPRRVASGPLAGMVFCFTGGLSSWSRDDARRAVEAKGASTVPSLSSKVTHVVAGTGAGTKLAKAKDLGVVILDEEQFRAMLEQP
jgi:DNA ligase (NAD+)